MQTKAAQTAPGSSLPERIGSTPLLRLDHLVRGLDGITLLAKAEWANPGGSVKDRAASAMVRDALAARPARARQNSARRQQRQHRHCAGHAGRGARLPRPSRHACQRFAGTQADCPGLRRHGGVDRSRPGLRRRHPPRPRAGRQRPRNAFATSISIRTTPTGWPTTTPPARRFWRRPPGRSPTLSPALAPPAPSWAHRAGSRSTTRPSRSSACSPTRPSTDSKASSTWAPRWFRPSTTPTLPIASWRSKPKPPTKWPGGFRAKKVCWWASRRPPLSWHASRSRAKKQPLAGRAVIVTVLPDSADKYLSERFWEEA